MVVGTDKKGVRGEEMGMISLVEERELRFELFWKVMTDVLVETGTWIDRRKMFIAGCF